MALLPSLVPRPLQDYISRDKILEWPGDEATCCQASATFFTCNTRNIERDHRWGVCETLLLDDMKPECIRMIIAMYMSSADQLYTRN